MTSETATSDRGESASHPSLEMLLEYHSGELSEGRGEEVRAHLVDCASCLERFLEIHEFEAAAAQPTDPELDEVRRTGWNRLESTLAAEPPVAKAPQRRPAPAVPLASPATATSMGWGGKMAAVLALLALGAGIVAAVALGKAERLEDELARWRDSEPAMREMQEEMEALRQDLRRTEGELELSHQERDRLATNLEALSSASGPSPGSPAAALALAVRPAFRLRSADTPPLLTAAEPNRLEPDADGALQARFELPSAVAAPELLFLLRDAEGRILASQVKPTKALRGDLGTAVTLGPLKTGTYRLEILGLQAAGGGPVLRRYRLELAPAPEEP